MELLSPAGNREALLAAVAAGADAVYLGLDCFGARSYAGNFDAQGLEEAVRICHRYGRLVYVTVNTLVKEREFDRLRLALKDVADAHADAVLVQDMGVLSLIRREFPQLTVHASTQMTLHNAQGARMAKRLGMARAVPGRECTLQELERMAGTGIEIEAFGHGALCVSVSGQCLFSGMVGGRSGNRGRCAQPCRLPYTLEDGTKGNLLSTRDLMLLGHVGELAGAGVCSLKLEGRMKRPEYVAVVTSVYRKAMDAVAKGKNYVPTQADLDALLQIFNRGQFTEGYVMGKSHAALMYRGRPGHQGLPAARVLKAGRQAELLALINLSSGDELLPEGCEKSITLKKDVRAGDRFSLQVPGTREGQTIARLTSRVQMEKARAMVPEVFAKPALSAHLTAKAGQQAKLVFTLPDGRTGRGLGNGSLEPAKGQPLTEERARAQLSKLGDTPWRLGEFTLTADPVHLSAGELNQLRRQAIENLYHAPHGPAPEDRPLPDPLPIAITAVTENPEEVEALYRAGAGQVVLSPRKWDREGLTAVLDALTVPAVLELPQVMTTDELDTAYTLVCSYSDRICGVMLNNLGQFEPDWSCPVLGGPGLNIMNSAAIHLYRQLGARMLTLSPELNAEEILDLEDREMLTVEAFGRTQLMLLHHCPVRTGRGDERMDHHCRDCQSRGGFPDTLTDRRKARFPLRCLWMQDKCLVSLYNSVALDMSKQPAVLRRMGTGLTLRFMDEDRARRLELTESYAAFFAGGPFTHLPSPGDSTGHLLRGVE